MVGPVSSRPSITSPRITDDTEVKQAAAKKTEGQDGAATPSAKKGAPEIPGDKSGTAKKAAESSPSVKGGAGSAPAPAAGDLRPKKKAKAADDGGGVAAAGGKDPVEKAMVDPMANPPNPPGAYDFGDGAIQRTASSELKKWSQSLGATKSEPGSTEYKQATALYEAGTQYKTAQKDYNDTVQIKGQAVLTELDNAKASGAMKKMDAMFPGEFMESMNDYKRLTRETGTAYKELMDVAKNDAAGANKAVGAAEEKLKQLNLGDLKEQAEAKKAQLAAQIAKVKDLVNKGAELGDAIKDAGMSLSAKPLVEYAMKQLEGITGDVKGKVEDAIKGKVTEMLAGPELREMAATEAKIQAYTDAIKDSKFAQAKKELGSAQDALAARMGALETARDKYVSKRTEQAETLDNLKSFEDRYNKKNPGAKSHVFEKLQDYNTSVAEKSKALAGAADEFQKTLQKPPFAGGSAANPDAKEMQRLAGELAAYYSKNYTGADKETKEKAAYLLGERAKEMMDYAKKESAAANAVITRMGRGDQFGLAETAVAEAAAAAGGKASKDSIVSPR